MMYTLEELENMETNHSGQFDNLKIETENKRVWLSRMTVADGMPYNNQVTIEYLKDGVWRIGATYQAR